MKRGLLCVIAVYIMIIGLGCSDTSSSKNTGSTPKMTSAKENPQVIEKQAEKVPVILYFADRNTGVLIPEKRMVDKTAVLQKVEETIVNELIKGPEDPVKAAVIPKGTRLLSVKKDNDTVIVDFSEEFDKNHPGGSASEMLTIYSVVNSLTELKDIDKVKFLIEGKERKEYKGHYQFDIPFERDETVITNKQ